MLSFLCTDFMYLRCMGVCIKAAEKKKLVKEEKREALREEAARLRKEAQLVIIHSFSSSPGGRDNE